MNSHAQHLIPPAHRRHLPNAAQRLYAYIGGANEEEVKIPMTSPVRVEVEAAAGPFCKNNFTVSFFVPFSYEVT